MPLLLIDGGTGARKKQTLGSARPEGIQYMYLIIEMLDCMRDEMGQLHRAHARRHTIRANLMMKVTPPR
eukprot:8740070-Pyramimonas_sp.AAC.1